MGNANVYTTLNVYTEAMDESRLAAAHEIGRELFSVALYPGKSSRQQSALEMVELIEWSGFSDQGIVAQLAERLLHTQEVIGSSPVGPICLFYELDIEHRSELRRLCHGL